MTLAARLLLGLLVASTVVACEGDVIVTQVRLPAPSAPCDVEADYLWVQLYEVPPLGDAGIGGACQCVRGGCRVVATECAPMRRREPGQSFHEAFKEAAVGLQLHGAVADVPYCVRVIGARAQPGESGCPPELPSLDFSDVAMCGMTTRAAEPAGGGASGRAIMYQCTDAPSRPGVVATCTAAPVDGP